MTEKKLSDVVVRTCAGSKWVRIDIPTAAFAVLVNWSMPCEAAQDETPQIEKRKGFKQGFFDTTPKRGKWR